MPKATVYIIGEAESFLRSVRSTVAGSSTLKREFSELSLSASKSAEAQVKASALRISRVREEMTAIRELASTYKRGSEEQIAAMNLVARKQAELNRLQGFSSTAGGRGRGGRFGRDEREASGLLRGGVSGSGFGRIGFSALSGGAFFGSFLAAGAVRTTIDAATEAAAVEKQLAAQYKASGQALGQYRKQIDDTLTRESALSGFNKDELTQSYTSIFRAAGNTSAALKDEAIAADVARGRHMDLQAASLLVAKVINGNVGILKRYGIETYKGETATEALAAVQQKYAGQAAAGTTAQQRFTAELHNSEVIIGTALLPTVTKLLAEGAHWLDQANRSGRLQRDVNAAVKDGSVFFHLLGDGVHYLRGAIHILDGVTGSFKTTLELLIGLKFATTLTGWVGGMGRFRRSTQLAEAETATLRTQLGLLTAAPYIITLELVYGKQFANKIKALQEGYLTPEAHTASDQTRAALIPGLARQFAKERKAGYTDTEIIRQLRNQLGGNTDQANQLIGEVINYAAGGPEKKRIDELIKRLKTRRTGKGVIPSSGPIHEFSLTTDLQNALAAAVTPSEDKAAAEQALAYTQKLLNTGRLVGQAYTDALKERKKLYAEIARDSKKLAGGTGGSLLPLGTQESLAAAQGAAATRSLPALQTLLGEQEKALGVLRSQQDTGAARLKQLKEEAQLEREIASTQREIASVEKTRAQAADAAAARRILGLGSRPRQSAQQTIAGRERQILNTTIADSIYGPKATSAEIAGITTRTAKLSTAGLVELVQRDLGDKLPKATRESLEKINKVLELKFLPPDVLTNLRSRLSQIQSTLKAGLAGINQTANNYKGVSAAEFVANIPGLTRAQKKALEERYSQIEAHGGRPTGPAALGIAVPTGGDTHIHGDIHVHGVEDLDKLITKIEKRNRHKVQRGGVRR